MKSRSWDLRTLESLLELRWNLLQGLRVDRDRQKRMIKLPQPAYIQKVLAKYYHEKANPTNTPMKEIALGPNLSTEATQAEKERYQGMTGLLMFSMAETRPDIDFGIAVVARFAKNPSHAHSVSWCSKRQPTVALSSTEAEYIALTLAAKEATWLGLLLTELGLLQPDNQHAKINVVEGNSSASALLEDDTI